MNRFHFVLTLVITQLLFINCDAAAVSATEKEPGKEVPSVPDSGKRGDQKSLLVTLHYVLYPFLFIRS